MRRKSSARRLVVTGDRISAYLFVACLVFLSVQAATPSISNSQNDNDLVFDEVSQDLDNNAFSLSSQNQKISNEFISPPETEDLPIFHRVLHRIKRDFFYNPWFGGQQETATPPSPAQLSTDEAAKNSSVSLPSGDETTKDDDDEEEPDEGDEEDKDTTDTEHSGDMPSTTLSSSPDEFYNHYFRVILSILEPYLENYADKKSSEFRVFAYNVTRGLNIIFGPLRDPIIPTVISVQNTNVKHLLKVLINLDTSGTYTVDFIEGEIKEHIRQTRSLADLEATMDGLSVVDMGPNPPNVCKQFEIPCDKAAKCYTSSMKCDENVDCPDGSDELNCGTDDTESTSSTTFTSTTTTISSTPDSSSTVSVADTTSSTASSIPDVSSSADTSDASSAATTSSDDASSSSSTESTSATKTVLSAQVTTSPETRIGGSAAIDDKCRADDKYTCKNGVTLICSAQKCDGQADCPDGDDEDGCPKECAQDEFICDNDKCVSTAKKCDRVRDCEDGTDEINCTQPDGCAPGQWRCRDGICILGSSRCDNVDDCINGEDEFGCRRNCTDKEFKCHSDGKCIAIEKVCDRNYNDCDDRSDEKNCTCNKSTQFQCGTGLCIPKSQVCDKTRHCQDESDERNCPHDSSQCGPNQFACDDGRCLINAMRCNSVRDCPNGEDEAGCPSYTAATEAAINATASISSTSTVDTTVTSATVSSDPATPSTCLASEFRCTDGTCISDSFTCDGVFDCTDKSDEQNCITPTVQTCPPDDIMCGDGRCVDKARRCDGIADCSDNVDETNCPERCEPDEFQCETGHCILFIRRCDRRFDCPDGSDELLCPTPSAPTTTDSPPACSWGEFTCRRNFQCIPLRARCNGVRDCLDSTDEEPSECGIPTVSSPLEELNLKTYPADQTIKEGGDVVFQCRDEGPLRAQVEWIRGEQLPLPPGSKDINGRLEMPNIQINHSGVYICRAYGYRSQSRSQVQVFLSVVPYPKPTIAPPKFCGINEATCQNGQCIAKHLVCDGHYDCDDRSDEDRCGAHGCEPNEFRCNNRRCVQKTWRCDSQDDCGDSSDEQNCEPSPPGSPCRYDEFQCGTGNQCIPKAFHCDGEIDCHGGSDEVGCTQVTIIAAPPHMTTLDQGETFTVTCRAYGVPTPEVIWRLNWGHVPAKCIMTSVGGYGTLVCPDVQEADQGAYSCEALSSRSSVFATPDAILIVKRPASPSCPVGTFNDLANTTNDCISCFCFGVTTECKSADLFLYQLPPPITLLKIVHVYFSPTRGTIEFNDKLVSPLQNYVFPLSSGDGFHVLGTVKSADTYVEHGTTAFPYFTLPESFYGNQLKSYGGYIKFTIKYEAKGTPTQVPLIILSGNGYKLYHKETLAYRRQSRDVSVRIFVGNWYKELPNTGDVPVYTPETLATREEIMMALANIDHILIQIQFVDAEQVDTSVSKILVDSAGVANTGQGQAAYVEECRCPAGYTGLSCEYCGADYSRRTEGPWLGHCYKERQICSPGTYGDPERGISCKACPCPNTSPPNKFGSTCYLDTDGQPTCNCPAGYVGRRCEQCSYGYIGDPTYPGDYCKPAPCDPVGALSPIPDSSTGQCTCKDFTTGQYCNQCKPNTFHLSPVNVFGCISCFCMGTTNQCQSSNWYRQQVVSTFTRDSQDFKIAERRNLRASSADFSFNPIEKEIVYNRFPPAHQGVHYWILPLKFLHDKVTSYGGYLNYTVRYVPVPGGQLSRNIAPDVQILSGNKIELLYFSKETLQANVYQTMSVPLLEQHWQRPDGATANREHLLMALADLEAILVKATYTTNTQEVAIQYVSLDIAVDRNTGQKRAYEVEECSCPAGYRGLSCQDCDVGYTRVDQGLYLGICELCSCNGHSSECHPETGVCLNCANYTTGDKCDKCIPGYAGRPESGEACTPITAVGCNCDHRGVSPTGCINDRCICKTNVITATCARCRPGTFDLQESHPEGCISCYCSGVTDHCSSSNLFLTQIPVQIIDQWHGFTLTDSNRQRVIKTDFILNIRENQIGYDYTFERGQRLFWSLPPAFTGDRVTSYGGNLTWTQLYIAPSSSITSYDTDVVVFGNGISIHWTNDVPLVANRSMTQSVPFVEGGWRRLTSSGPQRATRNDIMLVLSSVEAILIRAFYASQTSFTYISDVSLDTALPDNTGQPRASHVESCQCPLGYKGFSCEACSKGFYRSSSYSGVTPECRQCPCNGNEESCSLESDYTIMCNCLSGYTGRFCEIVEQIHGGGSETNRTSITPPTTIELTSSPTVSPPIIYVKITEPVIQIVAVGSVVRYKCSAESIYKRTIVSVKWSKQDGDLPRERAFDNGAGQLILQHADASDSGVYICTAFDGVASASQRVYLTVGDPTVPKVLIYPSSQFELSEGDTLEVTCQVTGIPYPDIEWGRLGTQLASTRSLLRNVNKLRLEGITRADEDTYFCRASNYLGSDIQTFTVRVDDDIETRFPKGVTKLVVQPTEFTGNNGDIVRFECSIISGPGVNVSWTRSGNKPLPPATYVRSGVLIIYDAAPADSGTYICQALNDQGVGIGSSVSVLVNILRSSARLEPPVLSIQPQNQTVPQGTTVAIRCFSTSDPDAPIEWSKSNEQLPTHVQISGSELRIPSVRISDRGIYLCRAANDVGPSQVSSLLEVERREVPAIEIYPKAVQTTIEGSSAVLQCRTVAGVPTPRVIWYRARNQSLTSHAEILQNGLLRFRDISSEDEGQYICSASNVAGSVESIATILVNSFPVITLNPTGSASFNIGQRVHLECRATGKPPPNVVWIRHPASPYSQPRPITTNSIAVFDISSAQESDSGIYTCQAVNDAGSAEDQVQLVFSGEVVEDRPTIRFPYLTAPSVLPDEEFVYPVGGVVTVRCDHDVPKDSIQIRWVRPGGASLPVQHEIRSNVLIIYNVRKSDAGKYTCIGAEVRSGTSLFEKSANIRIIDPPQITLYPIKQVVKPGDNPYVRCSATGDEPIELSWSTQSGAPLPYSVQADKGHLQFRGITVHDAGKYVCRAKSVIGEAEAVAEVIVNTYARSTRPVITAKDRSQFATEGSSIDLKCIIESPTSGYTISWIRERSGELPRNSRIEGGTLHLYDLRIEDSDRYVCRISSPFGMSDDYVDLQVARTCLPDQFRCSSGQCISRAQYCDGRIDCLDNSDETDCYKYRRGTSDVSIDILSNEDDFKVGDTCVLICSVLGDVDANITWSKTGGVINNNVNIENNQLRINKLQIENSGVYKCSAVTRNGVIFKTYNLGIQLSDGTHSTAPMNVRKVPYGKTAHLNCTTDLEPPVNYSWIIHSNDPSLRKTVNSNTVLLANITTGHSGLHMCLASNDKTTVEIPTALVVTDMLPLFNTSSYLTFKPIQNAAVMFTIEIAFKPQSDHGLILYNGNSRIQDFVSFGLRDGFAEFTFDFGSGSAIVKNSYPLPLNTWYVVRLVRNRNQGTMELQNVNFTATSPGRFIGLDLNLPLYIGGAPSFRRIRNSTGINTGFVGCISYVTINSKKINLPSESIESHDISSCDNCATSRCLNGGICQEFNNDVGYSCICPKDFVGPNCDRVGYSCYPGTCGKGRCIVTNDIVECLCPYGKIGIDCSQDVKIKLPAFNGKSYSAYSLSSHIKDFIKIGFTFKLPNQYIKDGILLYAAADKSGRLDFIMLSIVNNHIVFNLNTDQESVKLISQKELLPRTYTSVVILINETEVSVSVNDEIMKSKIYDPIEDNLAYNLIKLRTPLYIGGYDIENIKLPDDIKPKTGFYGCVTELSIMDTNINLMDMLIDAANLNDCYDLFGDLCFGGNPCLNSGECTTSKGDYSCRCMDGFRGKHCQLQDPDVCAQEPCYNGGTCSRLANSYVCDCSTGYGGRNCDIEIFTNISFDGKGYAQLPSYLLPYDTEELITFVFVTTSNDGLLFWNGRNRTTSPNEDFLAINVENGYVTLTCSSDTKQKTIKATDHKVSDGALHRVTVKRQTQNINLELDNSTTDVVTIDDDLFIDEDIYIGGVPYIHETTGSLYKYNFNGCIQMLHLDNVLINFGLKSEITRNVDVCSVMPNLILWNRISTTTRFQSNRTTYSKPTSVPTPNIINTFSFVNKDWKKSVVTNCVTAHLNADCNISLTLAKCIFTTFFIMLLV